MLLSLVVNVFDSSFSMYYRLYFCAPVAEVLVSFLELRFLGKMALLALGGRPQPLKKPSRQKSRFFVAVYVATGRSTTATSVKVVTLAATTNAKWRVRE